MALSMHSFTPLFLLSLIPTFLLANETAFETYYQTAKKECHDILAIRKEINRINEEILELLTERTAYVQRAGDLKAQTLKIANDSKRVQEQEAMLLEKSNQLGLPQEIVLPTFRSLVNASIEFEQAYIDQWK